MDNCIIGYMSSDMKQITTWNGDAISSRVIITAKWRRPRESYISIHLYQVRALCFGKWYTGRTAGGNMAVRLKPCK